MNDPDNTPFFILGPPRSGTTMLRNVLRSHKRLICPEETFYYRWGFPLGTNDFANVYRNNKTIKAHREIDGIDEEAFQELVARVADRRELIDTHGQWMLDRSGKQRWFDKTPQNVYGVFLIKAQFPTSKFVHIHRNPLNVVASLVEGKQLKGNTLTGSINYWLEAVMIIDQFRQLHAGHLFDLRYEDFCENANEENQRLLDFLGESMDGISFDLAGIRPERNRYREVLTTDQIDTVLKATDGYRQKYGYD